MSHQIVTGTPARALAHLDMIVRLHYCQLARRLSAIPIDTRDVQTEAKCDAQRRTKKEQEIGIIERRESTASGARYQRKCDTRTAYGRIAPAKYQAGRKIQSEDSSPFPSPTAHPSPPNIADKLQMLKKAKRNVPDQVCRPSDHHPSPKTSSLHYAPPILSLLQRFLFDSVIGMRPV